LVHRSGWQPAEDQQDSTRIIMETAGSPAVRRPRPSNKQQQEGVMSQAMRSVIVVVVMLVAALMPHRALAAVEVTEWKDVAAVTGSGQPASAEDIKKAFMVGGARRNWVFTDNGPGRMTGKLVVRTHTLVMDLSYETGKYTLKYVDSINLDYKDDAGKKTIHKAYLNWNTNLMNDARAELLRL
jgi:hypothetical protein